MKLPDQNSVNNKVLQYELIDLTLYALKNHNIRLSLSSMYLMILIALQKNHFLSSFFCGFFFFAFFSNLCWWVQNKENSWTFKIFEYQLFWSWNSLFVTLYKFYLLPRLNVSKISFCILYLFFLLLFLLL